MSQGTDWVGGKAANNADAANPKSNEALAKLAEAFAQETAGARQGLLQAMEEVLSTGGSTIPIINRSIEASHQASSNALKSTDEDLARTGLAGTPFGENIRAGQKQQGQMSAAMEGEKLAQAIFQMIPNLILGQGQSAMSGLGGAATNSSNLTNSMMNNITKSIWMGK